LLEVFRLKITPNESYLSNTTKQIVLLQGNPAGLQAS
jgi:hypothetical protein